MCTLILQTSFNGGWLLLDTLLQLGLLPSVVVGTAQLEELRQTHE